MVDGNINTWWQSQAQDQPVLISLRATQVSLFVVCVLSHSTTSTADVI